MHDHERGSSSIELLITGILLVIPLAYLSLSLAHIQSALLAAEGGARQAARLVTRAESMPEAYDQAALAVKLAFDNHQLDSTLSTFSLSCFPASSTVTALQDQCLSPGTRVNIRVETMALLPLVPGFIPSEFVSIPVSAEVSQIVSKFAVSAEG